MFIYLYEEKLRFVLVLFTNSAFPYASQSHLPFAVVGSTEEVKIGNKMVKARQYPWGTVQGKPGFTSCTGNESTFPRVRAALAIPSPYISPQLQ